MFHSFQGEEPIDFQNVGVCCREALKSLAQKVYEEVIHETNDTKKPSDTDYDRMLDAYFLKELKGSTYEEYRRLVKAVKSVVNVTRHKRTVNYKHASLSLEATTSIVEIVKILELDEQKLK